jgi:serine/threonine-protein kinase
MGGEVKLSDFGIAKAMTQSLGTGAGTGTIRGKLAYASPEQLRGEPVDQRADQFGAGVTLWEMLSGARLFDGPDEAGIIGKVMRSEIAPLAAELRVDPAVEGIARRMLSSQVAGRFPSTGDALAAVLAAPGYTSDASSLAELMRELFVPRQIALPRTVPMKLADPSPVPVGGLAETSPLDRRPSESPVRAGAGILASSTGPSGGSAAVTAPDRPRHGSATGPDGARQIGSSGSSGGGAARTASRARRGRAADPITSTGARGAAQKTARAAPAVASASDSGYVSSASLEVPTAPPRASLVARPVQIAVVATAALSAAVGAFALVRGSRRHARPPVGAEAPVVAPSLPPAPAATAPNVLEAPIAPSQIEPSPSPEPEPEPEPEPRPNPESLAPPPSMIVPSPLEPTLDPTDDREPSRSFTKPASHSTHHARVPPRDATTDPHPDRHGLARPSSAAPRSSRAGDSPNGSPILE